MKLLAKYLAARGNMQSSQLMAFLDQVYDPEASQYGNDCRLIALEIAGNPNADENLLDRLIHEDDLEVCYRVANNIAATAHTMAQLYNKLVDTRPGVGMFQDNSRPEAWLLVLMSMIESDNMPKDILELIAQGSLGEQGKQLAIHRLSELK